MSRRFEQLNIWWRAEATRHFLWVAVCLVGGSVTALWFGDDGSIHAETSRDWQGNRAWSVKAAD
jgi:hypothetical protein